MLYLGSCRCQPEFPGNARFGMSRQTPLLASRVLVPPQYEVLTLADVKLAHRIDNDLEDMYLSGLIVAAREYVERYLGQSLVEQTREADYVFYDSAWPSSILPFGPVHSVESVTGTEPYVVRYVAGYDPWQPVPESIKLSMQLLIGNWYENREQTLVGRAAGELSIGVKQLLDFYRERLGIA